MVKLTGYKITIISLFITSLALAACGQQPMIKSQSVQADISTPVSRSVAPLAKGTYTTTVTQIDLPSGFSATEKYFGTWHLKLGEDGSYATIHDGVVLSYGRYYLAGNDELVFYESRYSSLCPTAENNLAGTTGIYTYSFDGQDLALTAEFEDCGPRNFLMQAHALSIV